MKIRPYKQWVIAVPLQWHSRDGSTHDTMDCTLSYSRRSAVTKLRTFYEDWSDRAPERHWTWKQFYRRGYRAVRVVQVLA